MAGNQHLVRRPAGQNRFTVGQRANGQLRIHDYFIDLVLRESLQIIVGKAENPILRVITGAVWNPFGPIGDGEKVRPQLSQRKLPFERHAVAEQMQIASFKIDQLFPAGILDVGVADIPFLGMVRVEYSCPLELRPSKAQCERSRAAAFRGRVASDATADRVKLAGEVVHPAASVLDRERSFEVADTNGS